MEIKSLDKVDLDTIFEAFNQAFADYELQLNKEELQSMLNRRGYNPQLSFAAFEGNRIIAFTFNGIGYFNEIPTAYDTGTGTLKEYRGKGLATKIFEYSIPYLREVGIKQYLLEVLQHNKKAVSVYKNLGFKVSREFNYFRQECDKISFGIKSSEIYSIKQMDIKDFDSVSAFWDFYPSWQNNFDAINRASTDFICLGVFLNNQLLGYCVFEPLSGDITQIAIDKQNRRKGIASLLLKEITQLNKTNTIKVINTEISCSSITHFLESKNINITGLQYEMVREV